MPHAIMRHLRVMFEDDEFDRLEAVKGDRTWRKTILEEFGVRESTGGEGDGPDEDESPPDRQESD